MWFLFTAIFSLCLSLSHSARCYSNFHWFPENVADSAVKDEYSENTQQSNNKIQIITIELLNKTTTTKKTA